MRIWVPDEIRQLEKIYEPYQEGCHLVENAPKEAVEAFNKELEWYKKVQGDWQ